MRVSLIGLIAAGHSGVPRYAAALVRGMDRVAAEFGGVELELVTTRAGADAAAVSALGIAIVPGTGSGGRRVLAEQLAARSARPGLLHFFDLTAPLLAPRRPFTTTMHDAALLLGPKQARHAHKRVLQPLAVRRARAVVAVSAFAKQEAVAGFGGDPARIHVVHSGPGLGTGDAAATRAAGAPPPDGPYVLYVGNFAGHKNLTFLVRAFERSGAGARLVLVGRERDGGGDLSAALEASAARDRIELRDDATDAEVDALYRGASALALPSRYEGFGFTALEAMARDCPVLASDIPALREVSGDGALLLGLDDEAAWADALRRVVADPALRDDLRARGRATVARYSWDDTARGVIRVLQEAAG